MDIDRDQHEAELLARLEAEREQRLAEKIAAGEIISVPLFIVAGSQASALAQLETAKADKLAELRAADETREAVYSVSVVITGVCGHGEISDPASVPSAPSFSAPEDVAHGRHLPPPLPLPAVAADVVKEEAEEPQPPIIESYICVQTRACVADDDAGEIAEGWYSIDGKVLTVTDANGKYVGSRTMLKGEDARVVAKQLLREKTPESESFNRRLFYPNAGLA